jgi:hypothetical protein
MKKNPSSGQIALLYAWANQSVSSQMKNMTNLGASNAKNTTMQGILISSNRL